MPRERNLNLDIIRAAAIFLVLVAHVFISIGYPGESLRGAVDILPLSLWIISHACIPMFLMLSGWLAKDKTLSARYYLGLVRIVVVYVICSALCVVFRGVYLHEPIGLRYALGSIINFYACDYAWYACMYIGLFLLIPFLNLIYNGLESKGKRLALICTMFALSSLPSLMNQHIQLYSIWWDRLFPITYYFLGAYLCDYRPRISAGKALLLTLAALFVFSAFDVFMYKDHAAAILAVTNEHYQVFFVGLLAFVAMLGIDAASLPRGLSRAIVRISELSYAVYLLSWISDTFIHGLVTEKLGSIYARCTLILPAALVSFVIALLMAAVVMLLYRPLDKLIHKVIFAAAEHFGRKVRT